MTHDITNITQLLKDSTDGNLDEVLKLTYEELRKIARSLFSAERSEHTIQPTILVHEAFLKLQHKKNMNFKSRGHFYAFLGTTMRHILVDHFREKGAEKRGGLASTVTLVTGIASTPTNWDLLDLDEALQLLEKKDARKAKVVELKFFSGATHDEISEILNVSLATIERDWVMARAWLHKKLT